MTRIERILFSVDFSDHCQRAGSEVFALARKLEAELVLFHVLDSEEGSAEALERMRQFEAEMPDGVRTRQELSAGSPAQEILKAIDREHVDFVAMPTRGLGAVTALLLGSVTEQVLHRAHCPVWTEGQAGEAVARYADVLCCVDLGPDSEAVVGWAHRIASGYGAALRLLHVGHGDGALVGLRNLTERVGVEAECVVSSGELVDTILDQAERRGADLIVIGRGSERHLLGRFRSTAQSLVRRSVCAVLSV